MGQQIAMQSVPLELDAKVRGLDLVPVRYALVVAEGWSLRRTLQAEYEYRQFLQRVRSNPLQAHAPSLAADLFWHQHILCTELYAADCEQLFGRFMHHFPFGALAPRKRAGRRRRQQNSRTASAEMQGERRKARTLVRSSS